MARPDWHTLSPRFRAAVVALAAIEGALLLAAQIDITRRPAKAIAGSKGAWRLLSFVELAGPVAYFVFGRVDPTQRRTGRRTGRGSSGRVRRMRAS